MEEIEICGTCRFHRKQNGEWICTNPDSDAYALETEYQDTCDVQETRSQ